ncbi:MAG: hemerythrin domain-containing protein [Rubrivivax sp.]|jgi:hemerythrin-like domain-containing protein|nr:hemerythrin domain-containing protein [Rubrivivax sp.]
MDTIRSAATPAKSISSRAARPATAQRTPARGTAAPAAELPDIIRALGDEHRYQARLLNVLERQVGLLNQRQVPDYEVMHGVMRYMTQFPDRLHHPKEDLVFEKLVQRDPGAEARVRELLHAHETIIEKGQQLLEAIEHCRKGDAQADPNVLRKASHAYIGSLRRHMDIEHLHMFPRAQQVLTAADWAEVDARMKPILDPVFEVEPEGDFKALRNAEQAKPEAPPPPSRLTASLIEAAALIEAVATLIVGTSRIRKDMNQHHRDALRANLEMWRELVQLLPLDQRMRMTAELFGRNLTMFTEFNQRIVDQWSQVWNAAWQPYESAEGPYAPKLLRRRCKRKAPKQAEVK